MKQAIISSAIKKLAVNLEYELLHGYTRYSCHALGWACDQYTKQAPMWYSSAVHESLKKEYVQFSNAKHPEAGFWHLASEEVTQNYRMEMLYYFWLANQEM